MSAIPASSITTTDALAQPHLTALQAVKQRVGSQRLLEVRVGCQPLRRRSGDRRTQHLIALTAPRRTPPPPTPRPCRCRPDRPARSRHPARSSSQAPRAARRSAANPAPAPPPAAPPPTPTPTRPATAAPRARPLAIATARCSSSRSSRVVNIPPSSSTSSPELISPSTISARRARRHRAGRQLIRPRVDLAPRHHRPLRTQRPHQLRRDIVASHAPRASDRRTDRSRLALRQPVLLPDRPPRSIDVRPAQAPTCEPRVRTVIAPSSPARGSRPYRPRNRAASRAIASDRADHRSDNAAGTPATSKYRPSRPVCPRTSTPVAAAARASSARYHAPLTRRRAKQLPRIDRREPPVRALRRQHHQVRMQLRIRNPAARSPARPSTATTCERTPPPPGSCARLPTHHAALSPAHQLLLALDPLPRARHRRAMRRLDLRPVIRVRHRPQRRHRLRRAERHIDPRHPRPIATHRRGSPIRPAATRPASPPPTHRASPAARRSRPRRPSAAGEPCHTPLAALAPSSCSPPA